MNPLGRPHPIVRIYSLVPYLVFALFRDLIFLLSLQLNADLLDLGSGEERDLQKELVVKLNTLAQAVNVYQRSLTFRKTQAEHQVWMGRKKVGEATGPDGEIRDIFSSAPTSTPLVSQEKLNLSECTRSHYLSTQLVRFQPMISSTQLVLFAQRLMLVLFAQ